MKLKEVEEAELLFGEYDVLVKINAKDFNQIGKIVINKIRSVDGVIDTKTLPGISL
jgi:DNA-binding Lrp family transcriptional regulator